MTRRRGSKDDFDLLANNHGSQQGQQLSSLNQSTMPDLGSSTKRRTLKEGAPSRLRAPSAPTSSSPAMASKKSLSAPTRNRKLRKGKPQNSNSDSFPSRVEPGAISVEGIGGDDSDREAAQPVRRYLSIDPAESNISRRSVDQKEGKDETVQVVSVLDTVLAEDAEMELMERAAIEAEERFYKGDVIEGSLEGYKFTRKKMVICSVIALMIVLVAVVVGVVVGTRKSGNANVDPPQAAPVSTTSIMPTSSPTVPPPIFVPGDGLSLCGGGGVSNDLCECALLLDASNFGAAVGGTNVGAGRDPVGTCDRISANGAGVWYRLEGNNTRLIASTCESSADTQLSVFSGSCGRLQCVVGNDQLSTCGNGDQSQVGFFAAEGETYFIYVHGYRNTQGFFSLKVEPMVDNDACEMALEVSGEAFGSTAGARPIGNVPAAISCGVPSEAVGVWFRYTEPASPIGGFRSRTFFADTSTTGFQNRRVAVFEGNDCSTMQCATANDYLVAPGDTYLIFVYGASPEDQGDFVFSTDRDLDGVVDTPGLTSCSESVPLVLNSLSADISLQYLGDNTIPVGVCGENVRFAPFFETTIGFLGNWFVVQGNGGIFRATTCSDAGSKPTQPLQLSVYRGLCSQASSAELECIDGVTVSEECSGSSGVSWSSDNGQMYYIFVQPLAREPGRPQRFPSFSLLVEEIEAEGAQDCAENESSLEIGAPPVIGLSMEVSKDIDPALFGEVAPGSVATWYSVIGTGRSISVSTCHAESEGSTRVFVFAGSCGSGLVPEAGGVSASCGSHQSTSFDSVFGVTYHVAVLGTDAASFAVSADETSVNDICPEAIGTLFPDYRSDILGSTWSAFPSAVSFCGVNDESRDVYYVVQGTGADVRLFADPIFTDFDIRIQVLAGSSCSDLECILSSDTGTAQWNAVDGEFYYIRISGISVDSFGTFTLKFCEASDLLCT